VEVVLAGLVWQYLLPVSDVMRIDWFWDGPVTGQIWAASRATEAVTPIQIDQSAGPTQSAPTWLDTGTPAFTIGDVGSSSKSGTTTLFASDSFTGDLQFSAISPSGGTSPLAPLHDAFGGLVPMPVFAVIARTSDTLIAGPGADRSSLAVVSVDPSSGLTKQLSSAVDSEKTVLQGVSDVAYVTIGGTDFIVVASAQENGIATYALTATNQLEFRDTFGPSDGLWADGIDTMEPMVVDGTTFLLASSAKVGALFSLRVNPVGALFLADSIYDDLTTRFAHATSIDSFSFNGRSFAVTGGSDLGVTAFELLPDGTLRYLDSLAQTTAWDIGGLTAISATVLGTSAKILVAGATAPAIAQLELSLADIGPLIRGDGGHNALSGTPLGDLIVGEGGNDTLTGGNGDDVLDGGSGDDTLFGGGGADTFIMKRHGGADVVADFQDGLDHIDISAWGRIYDAGALTITQTPTGATIGWLDESITILSYDGGPLGATGWSNDDFIF